jgi:hypothetical protein
MEADIRHHFEEMNATQLKANQQKVEAVAEHQSLKKGAAVETIRAPE